MSGYYAQPWTGRKPKWARWAEADADREWVRREALVSVDDGYLPADADPTNTGWNEPGAWLVMNSTAHSMEQQAELRTIYVMQEYYRLLEAGEIEEHPDFPLNPPLIQIPD